MARASCVECVELAMEVDVGRGRGRTSQTAVFGIMW